MRALIVGNDRDLVELSAYGLSRNGHEVVTADDTLRALEVWVSVCPDLLLMELSAPPEDALLLCRTVRSRSSVPIVVFGSCSNETDLVHSYECGADDFITTPFSIRQLLVRLDALLRRASTSGGRRAVQQRGCIRVEDLDLDPVELCAHKNGFEVHLTPVEFRILYRLAGEAGSVIGADALASYTRQRTPSGNVLKIHVSRIRQKLAAAGGAAMDIRAVPRLGYALSTASAKDAPLSTRVLTRS